MSSEFPRILVVDDDDQARRALIRILEAEFPEASVTELDDLNLVLDVVANLQPSLIFMDWMFPGDRSGLHVCQQIKKNPKLRATPVILLSGICSELDKRCTGLEGGADLTMAKPFTREEVAGYTRALLRRSRPKLQGSFQAGPLLVRRAERMAWWHGRQVPPLPPKLFELLCLLAQRFPAPVSLREIVSHVWKDSVRDRHAVLAVTRLRQRLHALPSLQIESVPGAGYRLASKA